MALVPPTAALSPHPPAKAAGLASLKVPAAVLPLKAGQTEASAAKAPFQKLLDALSQAVKGNTESTEKSKGLVTKGKAETEKPKDAKEVKEARDLKKTETKDLKTEAYEAAMASLLVPSPRVEAAKTKAVEAESAQAHLEKAKTAVRDRRTGTEAIPAPVTAAAAEVARAQAQQNAPRAERLEERQRVFVVDRRTDPKEKEKLKGPGAEAAAQQPVNAAVELQTQQTKANEPKATDVQVTFQSVMGKNKEGFDLKPQSSPVSPRDAIAFQQYLVEKGYGQLVDQARIVLRDQNAGEIRMTLYPESLGKVKVSLELSDNSLAGQIFVENQTVKEVFQASLDDLKQAFQDGGWDTMSLEVSVGNGNGGQQTGERQAQTASARDYGRQVTQTAVSEVRSDRIGSWSDRQINLTA